MQLRVVSTCWWAQSWTLPSCSPRVIPQQLPMQSRRHTPDRGWYNQPNCQACVCITIPGSWGSDTRHRVHYHHQCFDRGPELGYRWSNEAFVSTSWALSSCSLLKSGFCWWFVQPFNHWPFLLRNTFTQRVHPSSLLFCIFVVIYLLTSIKLGEA